MGTGLLAIFAILTTIYAVRAFRKQSQEVSDQASMLKVQSDRLEVYRRQIDEQREINDTRGKVLQLQVEEISASLKQRVQEAEERRRKQAAKVTAWFSTGETPIGSFEGARVRNASDEPIFDVRVFFHHMRETDSGARTPVSQGGPPPRNTTALIAPGEDEFIPIPENVRAMFGSIPINAKNCAVSIEFIDAAENRWTRDPRGALLPRS